MKTIFTTLLFILTASSAIAGNNEITVLKESVRGTQNEVLIRILCIDGYKYILVSDSHGNTNRTSAPNMVQMMKAKTDSGYGRIMPIRCNE